MLWWDQGIRIGFRCNLKLDSKVRVLRYIVDMYNSENLIMSYPFNCIMDMGKAC